jgi:hypothetical protein
LPDAGECRCDLQRTRRGIVKNKSARTTLKCAMVGWLARACVGALQVAMLVLGSGCGSSGDPSEGSTPDGGPTPVAGGAMGCGAIGMECKDLMTCPRDTSCIGVLGSRACYPQHMALEKCGSSANCPADYPVCLKFTRESAFGDCVSIAELECACESSILTTNAELPQCESPNDGVSCIPQGDACRNAPNNCCQGLQCFADEDISTCLIPCATNDDCATSQTCTGRPGFGPACWPPPPAG